MLLPLDCQTAVEAAPVLQKFQIDPVRVHAKYERAFLKYAMFARLAVNDIRDREKWNVGNTIPG